MVLQAFLQEIKELSWRGTKYMAGNHSDLQSQIRKEQIGIVDAFQDGKAKIIVATLILKEGLDVQSCNVVIRFDQPANVCCFIQSQGRARMQGSEYVLIIRSDDTTTCLKVANFLNSGHIMREESLKQSSHPCKYLESEPYNEEFYCVETTGAKVTLSSSVSLIYFYCSQLPSDGVTSNQNYDSSSGYTSSYTEKTSVDPLNALWSLLGLVIIVFGIWWCCCRVHTVPIVVDPPPRVVTTVEQVSTETVVVQPLPPPPPVVAVGYVEYTTVRMV